MSKIAIVVCLLSAVSADSAAEADAQVYGTPYQGYPGFQGFQGFQGYNLRGYNQPSQEDAKVSLEMSNQLKDMAKNLFNQFIDLELVDTLKAYKSKRSAEAYNTPYQGYSQEDAKTSLERAEMENQLKDMAKNLFDQFIDLKLVDT